MRRRFRRRSLRGLGAVEGEKVEYFLPASIVNALGGGTAIAFCAKNVEEYLPVLEYKSRLAARKAERELRRAELHREMDEKSRAAQAELAARGIEVNIGPTGKSALQAERNAKARAKKGDIFTQTANEIRKDIAAIRAQGITGPIPACIYRSSGKWGDRLSTAEKRATVNHERFHADARREEYKLNVTPYSCDAYTPVVLNRELDHDLIDFSRTYWSASGRAASEEILARVEEVEKACAGEGKDCNEVFARINDWFISKRKPELAKKFIEAMRAVEKQHGTPLATFRAACKKTR